MRPTFQMCQPLHVPPLFQVSEMLTTGNAEGGGAVRSGRPHDYKARELNDLKFEDFQDTMTSITQVRGGRQKYRRYPMEGHLSGSMMPVRKVNSPLLSWYRIRPILKVIFGVNFPRALYQCDFLALTLRLLGEPWRERGFGGAGCLWAGTSRFPWRCRPSCQVAVIVITAMIIIILIILRDWLSLNFIL